MLARIRKTLLKLPIINALVSDYNERRKTQRHQERWMYLMSINYTIRPNDKPFKLEREKIIESRNWGGMK